MFTKLFLPPLQILFRGSNKEKEREDRSQIGESERKKAPLFPTNHASRTMFASAEEKQTLENEVTQPRRSLQTLAILFSRVHIGGDKRWMRL